MIPRLLLFPDDFERACAVVLDAASLAPGTLIVDRGRLGKLLVFCRDGMDAPAVDDGWRRRLRLPAGHATIDLPVVLVEQQGTPESQQRLAAFLTPLLGRLGSRRPPARPRP